MEANKNELNEVRGVIRQTLQESISDLGSPKATTFLKIVEEHYPDQLNHYKNIIWKESLQSAFVEFGKAIGRSSDDVDKVISKGYDIKSGNPFGISGKDRKIKESNYLLTDLINLSEYVDEVNKLKTDGKLNPADLSTLNTFFTEKTFTMINRATMRIVERHNNQLKQIESGNFDNLIDPYINQPVDIENENTVIGNGAYYQNETNQTKSHNFHNISDRIKKALKDKKIAGLRWLYSNAKTSG